MNILVTGGAGAIGTNLVRSLVLDERVHRVVVADDLSSGHREFLPKDDKVKYVHTDVGNAEHVTNLFKSYFFAQVYHLAAHFANLRSIVYPKSDLQTNVLGTINLLEAIKGRHGPGGNPTKMVYASSSCVYGNKELMHEDDPIAPDETPYAIDKWTAELYCKFYAERFAVPVRSVRIFNTYGPYELPGQYRNAIINLVARAFNNEDLEIYGTGDETRDFTYVSDTVDILRRAMERGKPGYRVYNAGTGEATRIKDLVKMIKKMTESESEIIYQPRRSWDKVVNRQADNTRAREELKYDPKTSLEDGLARTIGWYEGKLWNVHS